MQINVKITDLLEIDKLNPGHLFLVSQPIYDDEGASVEDMPYTSNAISAASLSSNIRTLLENDVLSVKNRWHFPETVDNVPTQGVKLETDDIIDALNDSDKLSSIIDDGKDGWYKGLSSSTLQNRENEDGENQTQSISVTNDSIPNIDFVQRIVAQAYHLALTNCMASPVIIPSYVGEIIHSTVLSSREMVREKYGDGTVKKGIQTPDTDWIPHNGYFLRGVAEGGTVINNSPNSDDGQDSVKMTSNMLIKHNHKITQKNANLTASAWFTNRSKAKITIEGNTYAAPASGGGGTSGGTTSTFNGATVTKTFEGSCSGSLGASINYANNSYTDNTGKDAADITPIPTLPVYKNVYIWERVL